MNERIVQALDDLPPDIQLNTLLETRAGVIGIRSHEDGRVFDAVNDVAVAQDYLVLTWRFSEGLRLSPLYGIDENGDEFLAVNPSVSVSEDTSGFKAEYKITYDVSFGGIPLTPDEVKALGLPTGDTRNPDAALKAITNMPADRAYIFLFYFDNVWFNEPMVKDLLRSLHGVLMARSQAVVLLSPDLDIPTQLEKVVTTINWSLPTADEFMWLVQDVAENVGLPVAEGGRGLTVDIDGKELALAKALVGLTWDEAEDALVRLVGIRQCLDASPETMYVLNSHRKRIVEDNPALTLWPTMGKTNTVGGLDVLLEYIEQVVYTFKPDVPEWVSIPPGVILLGPPGTGKTQAAKEIAGRMGLDLLVLDMGQVFAQSGGLVGQSEAGLYKVLEIIEAMSQANGLVLLIDEVEKGTGSGGLDGGTTNRVLASLLTWVNEKARGKVFIVATANYPNIDPAFVSRLDKRFIVALPGPKARQDIIEIHLKKRLFKNGEWVLDFKGIDLEALATLPNVPGISGREIELAIEDALSTAWRDISTGAADTLTQAHLVTAFSKVIPVSRTMGDSIRVMMKWADDGTAVMAGSEKPDFIFGKQAEKPAANSTIIANPVAGSRRGRKGA